MGMYTDLEMFIVTQKDEKSLKLKRFIYEYNNIEFDYERVDIYRDNEKKLLEKYNNYGDFVADYRATILLNNLNFTETDDYIIFETLGECSIKNYTETYEKFFKNCIEPLNIINGYFKTLYEEDDEYKIFLEKDKNEN